jgi:hypothetical protein
MVFGPPEAAAPRYNDCHTTARRYGDFAGSVNQAEKEEYLACTIQPLRGRWAVKKSGGAGDVLRSEMTCKHLKHAAKRNLPVANFSIWKPRNGTMMRPVVVVAALVVLSSLAAAQSPSDRTLAEAVREAAKSYRPITDADVAAARAAVEKAMAELDAFLRTGGRVKWEGWKRWLLWDELEAAVKSGQPGPINAVVDKLRSNQKGIERPEYTRLRDALVNYVDALSALAHSKSEQEFSKRMEELAGQLDAYAKDHANGDAALAIGRNLAWLEDARQSPDLVNAIRRTFGKPNFFGYTSRRFAAAGIERDIDQVSAISDCILGTSLHGTARLVGRTTLSLDDNPKVASMNILLGGNAWSNNIGYNGPVTLHSSAATSVSARKNIIMTADGLIGYVSRASCGTRSTIHSICAKCGLVERVAWKRAGQQKGQAEAIGSQHAGARVAGQMDREAGRMIAEQNEKYLDRFKNPLVRKGEFPEELNFSSTPDRMLVRSLQEGPNFIAAPDEPPGFSRDFDLAARMHESAVTNFGEGVLGGRELKDVELERIIRDDLKGEVSEELRVTLPDGTLDPEKEPWSITFAKSLPVRAKFNGGGVWMAIRADGFTRGEGDTPDKYKPAITELIEISAQYKIDKNDKGATMRREGEVGVRFPNRANPEQITVRDSPIVTFIRRKFRNLFKEEFVGEGLKFKGEWEKAGVLKLAEIQSDNAWVRLGWEMTGEGASPGVVAGGE